MKRLVCCLAVLAALVPMMVLAAPSTGAWQVYTVANGLRELPSYHIAPDGAGGVWVGHVSGGRGIYRRGGLAHVGADGNGQAYGEEPFQSCSSVDALALAPDTTLWMRLSGYHDYGSTDHQGACGQRYGITDSANRSAYAIGFIGADGVPQMLPKEQQPADASAGLAVDQFGRPWVGTQSGAAVREADGSWRAVALWGAEERGTTALRAFTNGGTIVAGSASGGAPPPVW
jgi:ligand-binding sensor domain-containing protein